MDLFTILGACLRRWYVTVPIVAVAGYLAAQAYEAVPAEYTSSMSIVVLPSSTPEPLDEELALAQLDNPYSGSGGPRFAAAVLARNINTAGYKELIGLVNDPEITFEASASDQQPMIRIDALAPTPEAVLSTLDAVVGQAEVVLRQFQTEAGAPEEKLYRIAAAVPADRVEDVTPSRYRTAGAIFVIGIALAGLIGTAVDVGARRWTARRAETRAARDVAAEASVAPTTESVPPTQRRWPVGWGSKSLARASGRVSATGPTGESDTVAESVKGADEAEAALGRDSGNRARPDRETVPGR